MKDRKIILITIGFGLIFWTTIGLTLRWAITDDPELNFSTNYEDYFPAPEGAEESHALVRRLTEIKMVPFHETPKESLSEIFKDYEVENKGNGAYTLTKFTRVGESSENEAQEESKFFDVYGLHDLSFADKISYLQKHEVELRYNWKQFHEATAILEELEKFETIGGDPIFYPEASTFQSGDLRTYAKQLSWIALLDAENGDPDKGLIKLHQYANLAERAKPGTTSLMQSLSWTAVSFICINTTTEIVENYSVSNKVLQDGINKIESQVSPLEIWERISIQETLFFETISRLTDKSKVLGFPIYLPKATANRQAKHFEEIYHLAKRGDIERVEPLIEEFVEKNRAFSIRNPIGGIVINTSYPTMFQFFDLFTRNQREIDAYRELLKSKTQTTH